MATLPVEFDTSWEAKVFNKSLERRAATLALKPADLPACTVDFANKYRSFSVPVPAFHRVWYDAFDDTSLSRLLLLAPRGHAKTSVVLSYVIHRLVSDPLRATRIGILSATDAMATAFLREVKQELVNNTTLIEDARRPFKPWRPVKWTQHEILLEGATMQGKDVSVFAQGFGSQLSGRRADLLIFDDVETQNTVTTEEARSKTRRRFMEEAIPILTPGGKAIVVGTRKHFDDLYSWLLDPATGWNVLDNATAAILPDGSPLWPDLWPLKTLQARKRELDKVDIHAWPQEYMNTPLPAETTMFSPMDWPEWYELPDDVTLIQAWDLAISTKASADYTCGAMVGIDPRNNIYIIDMRRGHWSFRRQINEIDNFGTLHQPLNVGIESVAYQNAAVQEAIYRTTLPIIPIKLAGPASDKVSRARLLEARAMAGTVYRPGGMAPWWPEMAQELSFFPAGAHDDIVDALVHAVTLAVRLTGDWDAAYNLTTCRSCARKFINPEGTRACPFCGAAP